MQKFANVLKKQGVKKGDRVTIYMPMIVEAAYAILACARIGAIHSVIFGGFSPDSIAGRVDDCKSDVIVTADEGLRGGRKIPLKANVDAACEKAPVRQRHRRQAHRRGGQHEGRPRRLLRRRREGRAGRLPVRGDERGRSAVHPLHVRLDRQAEGRAAHHRRLSAVFASITHQYVFDYHDGDIYWCTADVGWVTGHSYILYGPLSNGAITLMFEGVPNYPTNVALLGSDRQAQGQHLLHRADRDPRADAGRRRPGEEDLARLAASARLGRRADQSGSVGVVSTAWSATAAARSSTPGGRPRPAAS